MTALQYQVHDKQDIVNMHIDDMIDYIIQTMLILMNGLPLVFTYLIFFNAMFTSHSTAGLKGVSPKIIRTEMSGMTVN